MFGPSQIIQRTRAFAHKNPRWAIFGSAVFYFSTALGNSALAADLKPGNARAVPILEANQDQPSQLTQAAQIRELSQEQAGKAIPVRMSGVVLDYNQRTFGDLMIQEATGGIYVGGTEDKLYVLHPGQRIEVEGVTSPGEFAPIVLASKIEVLGEGVLPIGKPVSFEQLATGVEDGQWVTVRGVIRAATIDRHPSHERLLVRLQSGTAQVVARLTHYDPSRIESLVDAEASITGVCFPLFNRKRQLLSMRLSVPDLSQIQIHKASPTDPFAMEACAIEQLMRFDRAQRQAHRSKVAGIVTMQIPGRALFIRDQSQALYIETAQALALAPGDAVEVVGFPTAGDFSPTLQDATVRVGKKDAPPSATRLSAREALTGNYDADLIELDAELVEQFHDPSEEVLLLREGSILFRAHLARTPNPSPMPNWQLGSRLCLRGICLVQLGQQRWPESFRVLVGSSNDVTVLLQPPWWTLSRLLSALSAMTLIFLGAFAWAVTLRRRVRVQLDVIAAKGQREAVLEERTRIAREFHDTLEQDLTGIGMQLETATAQLDSNPSLARRIFGIAQSMVEHARSEAHRSVWELRARALEGSSLGSALVALGRQLESAFPVQIVVVVSGQPLPLSARIESHLLRIAQEALTNALKHSQATLIQVSLLYKAAAIQLSIHDNGCGFLPALDSQSGHFGLLGMRERAAKVSGELQIESVRMRGTKIHLKVPFSPTTQ